MTVDIPMIPTRGLKPGAKHPSGGMSALFHDYAGPALPDHMLQLDLLPPDGSTNHMMYEQEPCDRQATALSPCASTTDSTSSYYDGLDPLKGIYEGSEDLLDIDVFTNLPPFDPLDLKMEDVFQLGKRAMEGPTLAALNADQSVSPLDEAEAVLGTSMNWTGQENQGGWGIPSAQNSASVCASGTGTQPALPMAVGMVGQNSSGSLSITNLSHCTPASVAHGAHTTTLTTVASTATSNMPACSITKVTGTIALVAANKMTVPVHVVAPRATPGLSCNTSTSWTCSTLPTPSATVTSAAGSTVTPVPVALANATSASPAQPKTNPASMTESKWEEIKQFIHDDMELGYSLPPQQTQQQQTPAPIVVKPEVAFEPVGDGDDAEAAESDDEDMDSDADSEFNVTFQESDAGTSFLDDFILTGRKEKRYFWQYNTQSKGPKGKRLCKSFRNKDPHVLDQFEDPVFDPELNQNQYKHNGKARRGDGNDVIANPWKLYQIGRELAHLNRQMGGMVPVSEMPSPARSKTRKEKNKYASRACRLKKKKVPTATLR